MKKIFILLLAALVLAGCIKTTDGDGIMTNGFEEATFTTEDGFLIHGDLNRNGKEAVIMLHQLGMDKSTYSDFIKRLAINKYTALAIDLRGHGESLEQNGVKRPGHTFKESDFRNMEKDVAAAKKFLMQEGFEVKVIVGASIGANTALNYASHDDSIEKIVLLSPGLEYKGIETAQNAPKVKAKTLIIASSEDEYSFASSKMLADQIKEAEMIELNGAGHGTYMFQGTDIERQIIDWLKK